MSPSDNSGFRKEPILPPVTAPDDLARTLAACLAKHRYEARNVNPDGRVGWLTCSCGWGKDATPPVRADLAVSIWESTHLAEHLASVVSRRDADLRTRIETLANSGNHATGCLFWRSRATHIECDCWIGKLREALDADTHEVAP